MAGRLVQLAYRRIHAALRPSTVTAYAAKFKLFLAFSIFHQFQLTDLDTILAFLEYMAQNGSRAHSVSAYVSTIKHYFALGDLDTRCLDNRQVHLLIKSVAVDSTYTPAYKANINIDIL